MCVRDELHQNAIINRKQSTSVFDFDMMIIDPHDESLIFSVVQIVVIDHSNLKKN